MFHIKGRQISQEKDVTIILEYFTGYDKILC